MGTISPTNIPLILVVDDDPEWLAFVCNVLAGRYPTLCVSNAAEASCLALRLKPTAVVLDVVMPGGKDGFSVFRDLGRHRTTRDIPVIMLTEANEAMGSAFSAEAMGEYLGRAPAAFLEKPSSPQRLLAEIERIIRDTTP